MSTDVHRPLMTVREAANRLRVSEITIRRLIQTGELVAYQLGGKGTSVRIDAELLEQWLTAGDLEDLRREILLADERGDEEKLRRLRAEYRARATLERP